MRMSQDTTAPLTLASSQTTTFYVQVDAISALRKSQRSFQFTSNPSDGVKPSNLTIQTAYGNTVNFAPLTIQPGYKAFIQNIAWTSGAKIFQNGPSIQDVWTGTVLNTGTGNYTLTFLVVSPSGVQSAAFTTTFSVSA